MAPELLTPIDLRGVRIPNRAWVSPMAQYSSRFHEGLPTDWHLVHYGAFAQGGFGLIMTEALAVCPVGRTTPYDLGLWTDQQAEQWRRITDFVHAQRLPTPDGSSISVKIAAQLGHAGRRASSRRTFPGETPGPLDPADGGWQAMGPSPLPYPGFPVPTEMGWIDIKQAIDDFSAAARRALSAGFDVLEINAAEGGLLHEFYSPLSNQRQDEYGDTYSNRVRMLREVVAAVRRVWPGPLFVRIAATDWLAGGWDGNDSVALAVLLNSDQVDLADISTGGNAVTEIPIQPGYQAPFAERIRRFAGIPTATSGLITDPEQAETMLRQEQMDAVLIGRAALREPHWPQRAAFMLGVPVEQAPYLPQNVVGAWHGPRSTVPARRTAE